MPLDITDSDVYAALTGFFGLIVPAGTPILRGQQNRVPMPSGDFVLMTALGAERIGTNADGTAFSGGAYTASVSSDYRYRVQADFYGSANAEAWGTAAELLWRDGIAWDSMPSNIKPLYSDGLQQMPIIGAEDQWIRRWTLTLVLDYRPTWTQPTQTAGSLTVDLVPIEVDFAP